MSCNEQSTIGELQHRGFVPSRQPPGGDEVPVDLVRKAAYFRQMDERYVQFQDTRPVYSPQQ
jgi:hypothetical protein